MAKANPRAARERKQKIFVVVGGLLLLALLAFQLPKLLGGSDGSESTSLEPTPAVLPRRRTATTDPGRRARRRTGCLSRPQTRRRRGSSRSFDVFEPKDPFVQLVVTAVADGGRDGDGERRLVVGSGSRKPRPPRLLEGVLGRREERLCGQDDRQRERCATDARSGADFPALRSGLRPRRRASGSRSVEDRRRRRRLLRWIEDREAKVGRPLTLVNTATGARYKLVLVSVGSGRRGRGGARAASSAVAPVLLGGAKSCRRDEACPQLASRQAFGLPIREAYGRVRL